MSAKITDGYVTQEFDVNGKLINQVFTAEGEVEILGTEKDYYHPFDMKGPTSIESVMEELINLLNESESDAIDFVMGELSDNFPKEFIRTALTDVLASNEERDD